MLTDPLGRLKAETAHMEVGWVGYIAGTQPMIVVTHTVSWLSGDTEGGCAPGGSGGNLGCVGSGCRAGMGGYHVPHQ